eukprot:scaffold35921_cov101-Isochrysis_galbana.AAC.2
MPRRISWATYPAIRPQNPNLHPRQRRDPTAYEDLASPWHHLATAVRNPMAAPEIGSGFLCCGELTICLVGPPPLLQCGALQIKDSRLQAAWNWSQAQRAWALGRPSGPSPPPLPPRRMTTTRLSYP